MKRIKCAFVTGGTGLLGINIIKELLLSSSAKIVVLIRKPTDDKRAKFFQDLIAFNCGCWPCGIQYERIEIIDGDITLPDLGIDPLVRQRLIKEVNIIYHSAAVIKLSGAEDEVEAVNVKGTKHVLDFALACKEQGRTQKVVHVSTVGVAGDAKGVFYETDLDVGQGFNNPYEKSKFEAEKIVEKYREKGVNVLVMRPSMIIGDSKTGFTNRFNMFYFQLRLLSEGILDEIPLHEDSTFNLVPSDYVAKAIWLISADQNSNNKNYHIVNFHETSVRSFFNQVSAYLGYKKPDFISVFDPPPSTLSGVRGKLLYMYYPYINNRKSLVFTNAHDFLYPHGFSWPRFDDRLITNMLDFCIFTGYLKLKVEMADETRTYHP